MAKAIPTYTPKGKLPAYPGVAIPSRWDIYGLTAGAGERAKGGAKLAQFGRGIMAEEILKKEELSHLEQAQDSDDIINQRVLLDDNYVFGIRDIEDTADPITVADAYLKEATAWGETQLAGITDEKQRIRLEMALDAQALKGRHDVLMAMKQKRTSNMQGTAFKALGVQLENLDWLGAEETIGNAYDNGWTSETQHQDMLSMYAFSRAESMGWAEGKQWLKERKDRKFVNVPELDSAKRATVFTRLGWMEENMKAEEVEAKKLSIIEQRRAAQDHVRNHTFRDAIAAGEAYQITADLDDKEIAKLSKMEEKDVNEKRAGRPAKLTNEGYSQTYDIMLDWWSGKTDTKDTAYNELFALRYSKRNLDEKNFVYFEGLLDKDYPDEVVDGLRTGKDTLQRSFRDWRWKGVGPAGFLISENEEKQMSRYIKTMLDWLNRNIDPDKGKYPSGVDVTIKSKETAVLTRPSAEERLAYPLDDIKQKEWDTLNPEERETVTMIWYGGDKDKKAEVLRRLRAK